MERKSGTKCPEMIDFYVKEEYKNIGSACKERCVCHMPIDDFPGWPWMFTSKGFNHGQKWLKQMEDRNQDAQGIDIDVYFTGYGIQEVVENIVSLLNLDDGVSLMLFRSLLNSIESWLRKLVCPLPTCGR